MYVTCQGQLGTVPAARNINPVILSQGPLSFQPTSIPVLPFPLSSASLQEELKTNKPIQTRKSSLTVCVYLFFQTSSRGYRQKRLRWWSLNYKGLWQLTAQGILTEKTDRWPWIQSSRTCEGKDEGHRISVIYVALCFSLVGFTKNQCIKIYERIWKLLLFTSDHLSHKVQGQEIIYSVWDYKMKLLV